NHRKAIRNEIARYAERFRAAQLEAVTTALGDLGVTDDELPPIVALLMMTGLTQVMALEEALGVTAGHDTTRSFIEGTIDRVASSSVDARTRAPKTGHKPARDSTGLRRARGEDSM
ncbi:MAG: hypothetical protein ABSF33_20050, partial [Acidimicrobiales bacterium]